jgi:photosystem II stability/assembly factor-like uncharacterized protein
MRAMKILAACLSLSSVLAAASAPVRPDLYSDLRWRNLGPFRGGWSTCVEGIPDRPDVFYFGAAVGGVWKTEDSGETWEPLFQNETTASVDSIAIAPSNPKILYVGTGQVETRYDMAPGDGVFRSDDEGKTWRRAGLSATRAIGRLLVDPKNPDVVLAAAFGHIFGPNAERGVFRTEDGGKTWKKTLFVDENTGAVDLASDPADPSIVYAALWEARNYPWLSYFQPSVGPGSGVYKSTDGGRTWKKIAGGGWPDSAALGRIGLAVASGGRVYAAVEAPGGGFRRRGGQRPDTPAGLYRSEDGGATWTRTNREGWIGSSYSGRVTLDPRDADTVYLVGQSIRRSKDGGKTFEIFKGAPGGDDYHFVWINPRHPEHLATASDQGTVVSVNGGKTWSSWYNQPTGQFYHLAADDRFPYWIYSGQQDSGTVGIASRSDYGAISYREWHPVGGDERDYDIPDPADPETIYVSGLGGGLGRFDGRTGQVASIDPGVESSYARRATEVKYRYGWFTPIAVSLRPPHAIYQGAQYLFRSTDKGQSWKTISPDLTRAVAGTPGCDGRITMDNAAPCGFGVIYSIALSPSTDDEIWVGTDDGRVQVTRDGGQNWSDVTPRGLSPWSKIASLDISALDPGTVYAAVDRQRLDDFTPHAYRTRDGGKTWTEIGSGLPRDSFVDVVRADPVRRGLLYAGTGTGAFVSFDDGGHWRPLQQNLPTNWVRDLLVHGDDLIAATQGRAIWVLDGVSMLRQIPAEGAAATTLFRPSDAVRVRRNQNKDTPLPPETPLGKNPPAGAVIDYFLAEAASPVSIEILDSRGEVLRRFASDEKPARPPAEQYFADSWLQPAPVPGTSAGHHRFVWDLHVPRPRAASDDYSIAAIMGEDTPVDPDGPLVPPGTYSVRLSAGGKRWTEPLTLKPDPRVKASPSDYSRQYEAARDAASLMDRSFSALEEARSAQRKAPSPATAALVEGQESFARVNSRASSVLTAVEAADTAPTVQAIVELESAKVQFERLFAIWKGVSK